MPSRNKIVFFIFIALAVLYAAFSKPVVLPEFATRVNPSLAERKKQFSLYLEKTRARAEAARQKSDEEKFLSEREKNVAAKSNNDRLDKVRRERAEELDSEHRRIEFERNRDEKIREANAPSAMPSPGPDQVSEEISGVPSDRADERVQVLSSPQPVMQITREMATTRFLYLPLGSTTVRFHVDANLGDTELSTISSALSGVCLSVRDQALCASGKRISVLVDKGFFSEIASGTVDEWPSNQGHAGLVWKLICASGGDDCFRASAKSREFKITREASAAKGRILAYGFEAKQSRVVRNQSKTAKAKAPNTVQKVFVTRTTNQVMPLLPKGTLE